MFFRRTIDPTIDAGSWVATVLGVGLTLALFLSIGASAGSVHPGDLLRRIVPRDEPVRPERIVFETVPSPAPQARRAPPPTELRRAPPSASAPERPAQPAAPPLSRARTVPDSAGRTAAQQSPASTPTGLAQPDARLAPPDVRLVPPIQPVTPRGASGAPSCTAPCAAGARSGVSVSQHTLTAAERDSVLQAISASVPALAKKLARDSGGRAGDCPGCAGIPAPPSPSGMPVPVKIGGISIPLPGGGPSPAQRKRDSTINAHTLPILDRLKQRADSVKAARRRDSLEAIRKQHRDSTSGVKPQHDSSSTFPSPITSTTCVLPRCRTQAVPLFSRWRSSARPSSRSPDS